MSICTEISVDKIERELFTESKAFNMGFPKNRSQNRAVHPNGVNVIESAL